VSNLYNSRVMKLQSAKCPWCAGNCLLWVRCLRWYRFDAVDCGGSSWCSVWCGLFIILLNSWSSHFSSSSPNSGRSAGQKPHRLIFTAAQRIYSLAVCRSNKKATNILS